MNPIYLFYLYTTDINLFNTGLENTLIGYRMVGDGFYVVDSNYNVSGKIILSPGESVHVSNKHALEFFDQNNNSLFYFSGTTTNYIAIAPPNTSYMRVCVRYNYWAELSVYKMRLTKPIYKDDLAIDYELETNQRFYRGKLSGKLSYINNDFDYINDKSFETEFNFIIRRSNNYDNNYTTEFVGKFFKTDCTFNIDNKKITVQPDTVDQYNDVLSGIEKEYNLISITPKIERLLVAKRPLIQIYVPGDSIVSCFLGGTYWEQDANVTTDRNALINTYHFALCNKLKEINVTQSTNPDVNALYTGRMSITGTNTFTGNLYPDNSNGYYIYIQLVVGNLFTLEIRRASDNIVLYNKVLFSPDVDAFDNTEFDANAVTESGATGYAHCNMSTYNIYARYLLDVDSIRGLNTYELPTDDIVDYNRNYRRAIGYAIDIAYISREHSNTPTEWGLRDDGQYFMPPYSIYGQQFFPIARSTWRYASIWFGYAFGDDLLEVEGRKTYILRDAYPIGSVIQSLLSQFAPGILHEETEEYSQFLYSGNNPIAYGQNFRLLVTQKSNILIGDYQQPAQKAPTTLQQFTNMLRDCFQLYWYIEDNKFKIEHISWFKNGGSYGGIPVVGTDLTELKNIRNGKTWGYNTSEWSFDKVDMAQRFQFKWMDDVTQAFEGLPIEVISKYVTPGKIEDINISNFTSDVDMMILNPSSMSNDGFAIFAAVNANALSNDDSGLYPGFGGTSGTNGLTTPTYGVRPECVGRNAIINFRPYSDDNMATGFVVFYNGSSVISTQGNFVADGLLKNLLLIIPDNATAIGLTVTGTVTAYFYYLKVLDQYELPFIKQTVNGVNYYLQNGFLSFINLHPNYWIYNLPARQVNINGITYYANGIERKKKQTLNYPVPDNPNPLHLVKTYIGNAEIDKMSVNLCSRMTKTTVKYDTE